MEHRQLKTFQTVATLLSFNRAAAQLHYAQSSVSAHIQALEDELGVPLFDRIGRKVVLTEAGEKLLGYASRIMDLTNETISQVTGTEPTGGPTIRVPETLGIHVMPEVIQEFSDRFPKVSLRLITCAMEGLARDLGKGLIDMALLFAEGVQSARLNADPLMFEELVIVANPNHPLTKTDCVTTAALAREQLLWASTDCAYLRMFERLFLEAGVSPRSTLEFNSIEAIRACVRRGVGITILPRMAVQSYIDEGLMTPLPWEGGRPETAVLMIWHQSKWLSPTLLAFMDCERDRFSRR